MLYIYSDQFLHGVWGGEFNWQYTCLQRN